MAVASGTLNPGERSSVLHVTNPSGVNVTITGSPTINGAPYNNVVAALQRSFDGGVTWSTRDDCSPCANMSYLVQEPEIGTSYSLFYYDGPVGALTYRLSQAG